MYTDIHTDFIVKPISSILEDGIIAVSSLPNGIEGFPVSEYFCQSLFLRLTGASEQKMKCICWQLATDDYQYRYEYLNIKDYGECSKYDVKKCIYKDLITQIKDKKQKFQLSSIWDDISLDDALVLSERTKWESEVKLFREKQVRVNIQKQKEKGKSINSEEEQRIVDKNICKPLNEEEWKWRLSAIRKDSRIKQLIDTIADSMGHSALSTWRPQDFSVFSEKVHKIIQPKEIATDTTNLLGGGLSKLYNAIVYENRNRVAHNTLSYQRDMPNLDTISDKNYYKNSYFFRYTLMIIMDEVFVRLYRCYREICK